MSFVISKKGRTWKRTILPGSFTVLCGVQWSHIWVGNTQLIVTWWRLPGSEWKWRRVYSLEGGRKRFFVVAKFWPQVFRKITETPSRMSDLETLILNRTLMGICGSYYRKKSVAETWEIIKKWGWQMQRILRQRWVKVSVWLWLLEVTEP